MLTPEQIEALAKKHGAASYRNRVDTQHPAYGFTEAGLHALVAEVRGEVRKEDEALIRRLMLALDDCAEDSESAVSDYVQAYGESYRPHRLKGLRDIVTKAKEALAAARARLGEKEQT